MSPFSVFTFSPPEPQAELPNDSLSVGPFGTGASPRRRLWVTSKPRTLIATVA
jgi:hypothetical protein